jgi:hypothetical protein
MASAMVDGVVRERVLYPKPAPTPAPMVQRRVLSVCPWERLTSTMSGRRSKERNAGMALRISG